MKVLIACEESQTSCKAFRALGHEAYSCDLQKCSGGHPEWHIQDDVTKYIYLPWDLIIAHPPCTFLAKSGSCNMYKNGVVDPVRYEKMMAAREFFMMFYNLTGRVCIENPVPFALTDLPPWSQVIQPWRFGDHYTKQTCLWLKNLPPLIPRFTDFEIPPPSFTSLHRTSRQRSKSFPSISAAMAEQWSF